MSAIVVIAASAGGLNPLTTIISALPANCTASVFIVMHMGENLSTLPSLLGDVGRLPATFAHDGDSIRQGHIYVAPSDRHMLLEPGRVRCIFGPKVNYERPAAEPLFVSAAEVYSEDVIGIVLGGGDGDGAEGLWNIKRRGGVAIVQDPEEVAMPTMPLAALHAGGPQRMRVDGIADVVSAFCAAH